MDEQTNAPEPNPIPLRLPLPEPPVLELDGIKWLVERVKISDLPAWRREHRIAPYRQAFLGRPGWRPAADGGVRWAGYGTITLNGPQEWAALAELEA